MTRAEFDKERERRIREGLEYAAARRQEHEDYNKEYQRNYQRERRKQKKYGKA